MMTLPEILSVQYIADAPDYPVFYQEFQVILEKIKEGLIGRRIIRIWISSLDVKIHFSNSKRNQEGGSSPIQFDFGLEELDSSLYKIAQEHNLTVARLEDYRFAKRVLMEIVKES